MKLIFQHTFPSWNCHTESYPVNTAHCSSLYVSPPHQKSQKQLRSPICLTPRHLTIKHSSQLNRCLSIGTSICALFTIRQDARSSLDRLVVAITIDGTLFQPDDISPPVRCTSGLRVHTRRVQRVHTCTLRMEVPSFHCGARPCNCGGARGLWARGLYGRRGAPSYFTVITVTCYRARSLRHAINRRPPLPWTARKEGTGVRGVVRGLLWRPTPTPLVSAPERTLGRGLLVTIVTPFSSLSLLLTWSRSSRNRALASMVSRCNLLLWAKVIGAEFASAFRRYAILIFSFPFFPPFCDNFQLSIGSLCIEPCTD